MKSNNFRDTWTVAKFSMRDMVNRKSFRISTIIILILIVIGFNIPRIITNFTGGNFDDTILISDPENIYDNQLESLNQTNLKYKFEFQNANFDDIKNKINNGEIDAAVLVSKSDDIVNLSYIVDNAATVTTPPTALVDALSSLYTNIQIQKIGLSATQISQISPTFNFAIQQTEDKEIGGNLNVMMLMSVLLFFAIYFCAFQVSSSITIEKTSKIMETLVTSTSPRSIILGKTIGVGIVGLLQILLFVITAIISAKAFLDPAILSSLLDLSNFTVFLAIVTLGYFILGYFGYALLYAVTGSTVAKPEDIQAANTPVAIVTMIGFYLAYFTLMDPTSSLANIAALLPISSPFCMPLRVMMGITNGWEVILSTIILITTCAIVAHIAIKIYSNAILNYGSRMSLKDIIRTYKEK